jgi:transcriptional regulator with XRE-family HTH domain
MSSFYRDLGRRIAEVRRLRGLTQERLAERASITTSYLARIETGARKPTLDVVRRLAEALGVEVWRLLAADHPREDEPWRGAAQQLVAAVQNLSREDVDLLIEVARRFGRGALEPPAATTSRAAEPTGRKPRP